jgi:hypothetical protein
LLTVPLTTLLLNVGELFAVLVVLSGLLGLARVYRSRGLALLAAALVVVVLAGLVGLVPG